MGGKTQENVFVNKAFEEGAEIEQKIQKFV